MYNGNVTVIINASGGIGYLHYTLDTTEQDEPIFYNVSPGTYTVTVTDSREPYPCSVSQTIVVADPLSIFDINIFNINCQTLTASVSIEQLNGIPPYTFQLDGSPNPPQSSPAFVNVPVGTHQATVFDSSEPYPCSATQSFDINIKPCPCPDISCIPQNKLLHVGSYSHGAPIQSVAWSCASDACPTTFAAIGGYKALTSTCQYVSIRVYTLDIRKDKLIPVTIDNALPTDYVYSVKWCCINGTPYLAVAGCPDSSGNSLWIYQYDPTYNRMTLVKAYQHNGIVYSVAWLCNNCTIDDNVRYLAIGGDPVNGIDIEILSFNATLGTINPVNSALFGSTIYSLDWCSDNNPCVQNDCNYLVAGGTTASDCKGKANIKIYAVSCNGDMVEGSRAYFEGNTVRSVKWCCDSDKICPQLMSLAVGGDPIIGGSHDGSNIVLYAYHPRTRNLKPFAWHDQPAKVFAVDWLPGCACTELAVGSGCLNPCTPNIFVYNFDKNTLPDLGTITSKYFYDNITSIAWCKICDLSYVLVGSEANNWSPDNNFDPLCAAKIQANELALYKGIFCKTASRPCTPAPICERKL